jgi:iron complex outermembrane recepter protein
LRLRGSHGTSYKAPNLADYNLSSNLTAAVFSIDPGAVGGVSYQLQVAGIDVAQLVPQESESSSFGLELVPASLPGLQVAANYYRIEYTDRIANPPVPTVMLGNPAAFGSLVIRDPSAQQVNDLIAAGQLGQGFLAFNADFSPNTTFSPDSIDVIVDARRRNLSVVNTSGVDLATQYDFKLGEGRFYVGLAGTYILELEQQVTPSSVPFDSVDTIYNPPHWRLRGSSGWQRGGWAASLWVNHTDAYTDNRSPVTVPVDAYTTVDVRMAYDFTNRFSSGLLSGLTVAMNVQNLLDEDPPHTVLRIDRRDSGFDPTNANPLGRFVALEISKSW